MNVPRRLAGSLAGAVILLAMAASSAAAAPPEVPLTQAASAVTGDSAVLHGQLNPGKAGEPGQYQFLYKISETVCQPGAEFFIPESPAAALGSEKEAVEIEAANLEPNQTYAFCLLALHEGEEAQGVSLTFKTLPVAKPLVLAGTTTATEVTPFGATLTAQVNAEKEETTYAFEYATNEALAGATTVAGAQPLPAEFGGREASVGTGLVLEPETTYFFRVSATNATGTTMGPVASFTTLEAKAPEVISESVGGLETHEPKIEAMVNPNFSETTYHFVYATDEAISENVVTVAGAPPLASLPPVSEELLAGPVALHGLQPGTTYFYRIVATNSTGTTEGLVQSFQALGAPLVSTEPAQQLTRTTALVSGSVTPQGLPSTYHFAYIAQAGYEAALAEHAADPYANGRNTYETPLQGPGEEPDYVAHPVLLTLEELAPGTTYHYALLATNELGVTAGPDRAFTTSAPTGPVATTGPVEGVSQLSATITGSIDTQGLQTTAQFEFGTAPGAGAVHTATVISSVGGVITLADTLSNALQPATTYFYRVIASNSDGVSYGAEQSFTTSGLPSPLAIGVTPPLVPFSTIAALNAKEAKETPKGPHSGPTRAERLARALKSCKHKPKRQRAQCRRRAHRLFGHPPKKHH